MQIRTVLNLFKRFLLSSRYTDVFRSRVNCFITQSFVRSYLADARSKEPQRLLRHGRKVYSQNDEDGIIAEIFDRIGTESRRFVEIGAADGLENNTVWLLLQGWSGTWVEGVPALAARISKKFSSLIANGRLNVLNEFVTRESARRLEKGGHFRNIDLFSLDIDGNDYHIMASLENIIIANFRHRTNLSWNIRTILTIVGTCQIILVHRSSHGTNCSATRDIHWSAAT